MNEFSMDNNLPPELAGTLNNINQSLIQLQQTVVANTQAIATINQNTIQLQQTVVANTQAIATINQNLIQLQQTVVANTQAIATINQNTIQLQGVVVANTQSINAKLCNINIRKMNQRSYRGGHPLIPLQKEVMISIKSTKTKP